MKQTIPGIALAAILVFGSSWSTPGAEKLSASSNQERGNQEPGQSPFLISVVPTRSLDEPHGRNIAMAKERPGPFYVVLSNVSTEPQKAFESWNGWGYGAVSFEVRTPDGHTVAVSRKLPHLRANYPSTFIIPPGEHMVYPISLDREWRAVPDLPMAAAEATPIKISIKAIYEVKPTPEAAKKKVWTGRTESKSYDFNFRHW